MRRSGRWRAVPVGLAVGLVMAVGGGVAWSAIPDSVSGVITACVKNAAPDKGSVRIIDAPAGATCVAGESRITWDGDELSWKGPWSATTAYRRGDVVVAGGSSFLARLANTGVAVTNSTNWGVLAQKGDVGPAGPTGPTGPTGPAGSVGPAGPSSVVSIGHSSRATTIPAYGHWTFMGVPFIVNVKAGDVLDVEGMFSGVNAENHSQFQAGICWRDRTPGAGVAGPVEGIWYANDEDVDFVAPAIRAISFSSTRTVDVGYCARYMSSNRTAWYNAEVNLTVRHLRGATVLSGSN